ncbi:anti-sigma factor [Deinococcus sp. YIM 134068]|uniref:anti-sigma factor n=1 Tax=Deinococcus lichenicola TaxID=3118910 RepID=UPI002F93F09F
MTQPDRDQLTAYALGLLPPEEEARVHAALAADPALRAGVDADLEALTALAETLPQPPVPDGAEERLLARLRAEVPRPAAPVAPPIERRPRRLWLPLAALGLAAALALFFVLRPEDDPLRRYADTPGAITQPLQADGNDLGQLVRLPDGRAYVYLSQPAETGRVYQAWQVRDGVPVSLGLFEGQGFLFAGLPAGATVAVSVEPPGGSEQPTTTPLLVQRL